MWTICRWEIWRWSRIPRMSIRSPLLHPTMVERRKLSTPRTRCSRIAVCMPQTDLDWPHPRPKIISSSGCGAPEVGRKSICWNARQAVRSGWVHVGLKLKGISESFQSLTYLTQFCEKAVLNLLSIQLKCYESMKYETQWNASHRICYFGGRNERKLNICLHNPQNLDVSAGDLLSRTHEELVLLLIQLRRQSSQTARAIEQCCSDIHDVQVDKQVHFMFIFGRFWLTSGAGSVTKSILSPSHCLKYYFK